ncbi:MAG TPA: response regulator transcription factor [Verrucomicrobiota bacterium]|nr:response regulator transcription factor [Verrucomicrobiota bacterium]
MARQQTQTNTLPQFTVVLIDDHPAFRLGVRQAINQDKRFEVVGEASDGIEALELMRHLQPDIAVVDISLPKLDGLGLMRQLTRHRLRTRCVILTMYLEESLFQEAMDLGAAGYILKDNTIEDIIRCLRSVSAGDCYLSPSLSDFLVRLRQSQQALRINTPGLDQLTSMERRILKLIAENKTSRQIGAELFISPRTVETHRRNICLKLGLTGSHPLLEFALRNRAAL